MSAAVVREPVRVGVDYGQRLTEPASFGFTPVNDRTPQQRPRVMTEQSPPNSWEGSEGDNDRKFQFQSLHESHHLHPPPPPPHHLCNDIANATPPVDSKPPIATNGFGEQKMATADRKAYGVHTEEKADISKVHTPSTSPTIKANSTSPVDPTSPPFKEENRAQGWGRDIMNQSERPTPASQADRDHMESSLNPSSPEGIQVHRWGRDIMNHDDTPHAHQRAATHSSSESMSTSPEASSKRRTPDDDGDVSMSQSTLNSVEQSNGHDIARVGGQGEPKKRKRQFSKRVKTGCVTCRARKKKCDELFPECANCTRGGFLCGGYKPRGPWPGTPSSKGPVLLQSKDGSADRTVRPQSQARETPKDAAARPVGGTLSLPPIAEATDDHARRSPWTGAWGDVPGRAESQQPASGRPYAQTPVAPAHATGSTRDAVEPLTPTSAKRATAPPVYSHPILSTVDSTSRAASTTAAAPTSLPSTTSAMDFQPHALPPPPPPPPPAALVKSEKEKMLSGELYQPYADELVEEREQCQAAVARFNQATNPLAGVSRPERMRLFRAILEAAWAPGQSGSLGRAVEVEGPFECAYGYNVHLGDEVAIGPGCTFLDPCPVVIGDRCVLGPHVRILGGSVSNDLRHRRGSRGVQLAQNVVLEEDVFVGGGATILPGVRIGKGSTVEAGSVVTSNVAPGVVVAGSPAVITQGAIGRT